MQSESIFKEVGVNKNGICSYINKQGLTGDNLKFAKLYDRIAWFYHRIGRIFYWIKFGSERKFREQFLKFLTIKDNDLVLETSVGTADNFRFLNKGANYYGVDISFKMLKKAKKHVKSWGIKATLVHCEAEKLPFHDNSFDVVYHCGGINFYNDKQAAVNEMIRVAKPGTRLMIVDETEKTVKEIYHKGYKKEYYNIEKAVIHTAYIPKDMLNINVDIVCKGYMYVITFDKPS